MLLEIERKFLVSGEFKDAAFKSKHIIQGYLCDQENRQVRIRIIDNKSFITIKGGLELDGISRFEWEKEIPNDEALQLIKLCEGRIIEKIRYYINHQGKVFEVDEFKGKNLGLTLCEVELDSSDESIDLPKWIGKEVTGDKRYYNISLI
ncbi:MAG: CYTH domain-containing protein [Bacteroidales bacterium]|nr:CYTH domain-containing protein [Bacteroidales bacterium]